MPIFPNVPLAPGVPAVPRVPGIIPATISLLVNDLISGFLSSLYASRWGIFQNGLPVIVPQSIISLDFKQDWSLSSYPQEQGAFQTYDKVVTPFETRVRMTSGTSMAERTDLLSSVAAIAGNLELYDVATPEFIHQSVNIHHWDYQRTATNGAGLIIIDLWLTQINVSATSSFSNTQQPGGANPTSGGQVQTQTPPSNFQAPQLN